MLYLRHVSGPRRIPGYPRENELNVAAVCAGYAFELIFKVLVRASGGKPQAIHRPRVAYRALAPEDKAAVDRISEEHRWKTSAELLDFLDKYLCDKNRKYWMRPPEGGTAHGEFHFGGRKGMDALRGLHRGLSDLAMKRINDNPKVYEDWPGTPM